ncbi:MAG: hypothetical protein ACLQJR_05775 [Stellaceae bacterium]
MIATARRLLGLRRRSEPSPYHHGLAMHVRDTTPRRRLSRTGRRLAHLAIGIVLGTVAAAVIIAWIAAGMPG